MPRNTVTTPRQAMHGFSLIELMIAITVSLLVLAGLTTIYVSNSQTRNEIERANRMTENGRYAMEQLLHDLRNAGYYAEFDPTVLASPAAEPDPCATALANLRSALPVPVQGYDNGSGGLACISDVRADTDVLVVRRASTCAVGDANCDAVVAGAPYIQASLCGAATELTAPDVNEYYRLDTTIANLDRHERDCTTIADYQRYYTRIYFVANNDKAGDGIPTLKVAELGAGGFTIIPLVEGIENLQLEYGLDTDATPDGAPNVFTTDPGSYNACDPTTVPTCVGNWQSAVSVKVNLLARNLDNSPGHTDNKTYTLGLNDDGTANTAGPFSDAIKRHAYQSVVRLNNLAGRRM
ncbi:MAG: PilW family protein [Pseudomonadota bacterium]